MRVPQRHAVRHVGALALCRRRDSHIDFVQNIRRGAVGVGDFSISGQDSFDIARVDAWRPVVDANGTNVLGKGDGFRES